MTTEDLTSIKLLPLLSYYLLFLLLLFLFIVAIVVVYRSI